MDDAAFLEALIRLPHIWWSDVSPDARWVAWSAKHYGPCDVFAAPVDGSQPPMLLTDTAESTMLSSWTPDSAGVIVYQDHEGDNRSELFRVDLERPLEMQRLTEPSPNYYTTGGQLHPNGRWLVYAADLDDATGAEIEQMCLYRHDLATGGRSVLARPNTAHWIIPLLNDQGTHVLYERAEPDPAGQQVWLVDIDGREDREIVRAGGRLKAWASWFPDGRRVLVRAETETHERVGVWSFDGGLRWLIDDPSRNIESAYVPRGSHRAVVIERHDTYPIASLLDVETGREEPFPDRRPALRPLARAADGHWLALTHDSQQPDELVRVTADGTIVASVSRPHELTPLRRDDFVRAEDVRWRSVDGLPVQGWLYRARGEATGTVVDVHGGPTAHDPDEVDGFAQYLSHRGFNVLKPNYRGSTGFGLAFKQAIKADGWGGREQDDVRTGIEALLDRGIAVPGRVGVTGLSYGGYSAWCAITRWPPEIVAAAAPICGMTDLVVDYESTMPMLRPYGEEMMGGTPESAPQRYFERSPVNFVGNIRGRLLIVQGMNDPNVTPENVRAVTSALDRAGVAYEMLTFDDEGHGVWREKNLKVLWLRLAEFFARAFQAGL
jgi:dipeptidyl aminopeptidase/acylaminoacyl peptidase